MPGSLSCDGQLASHFESEISVVEQPIVRLIGLSTTRYDELVKIGCLTKTKEIVKNAWEDP